MERTNVMPHQNSVFSSVLKHAPWPIFDRLVEEHGSDYRVRRLTTKSQFVAMLFAQLSGSESLREIESGLQSHADRLYHLGAKPAARSTLADANALRPSQVFTGFLDHMLKLVHRKTRRQVREATFLIDSTSVRLNSLSAGWARFSDDFCGAKAHVIYDAEAECPTYVVVTAANVNDITAAKLMPIVPGATYVVDLGYYDYGWLAELVARGCRVVTRFKSNTTLAVIQELPVADNGPILSDRIGHLPARQAKNRRNPFDKPVREVRVATETGRILRILSNDLDASAQEIADLYKRRWAIELFFRWIKQTLKITRFLGTSQNAVRIQIAVALIAFLLLRLAQATQHAVQSPLAFARLIRANLMHCRPIDRLLEAPPGRAINPDQLALQWT
jgi:hypothetical protein